MTNNGSGTMAKQDGQITDYLNGMGIKLEGWEFGLLRKMCASYVAGVRLGNDRFGIMPMSQAEQIEGE